ncbi:hypothetical protein GS682_32195 [Nostoc sp. B(2019)]|nr:hypothetical protein [Nostoc sp. B(2019)]
MKLSYDQETRKFVISELGRILDADIDSDALATRYGFIAPSEDNEVTNEAQEIAENSQNSWWATTVAI